MARSCPACPGPTDLYGCVRVSFLWRDYLTVAAALIQARNTFAPAEGRYRAAISRAYYAAYGATRNHARDHEGYSPVPTGRDHGLVAAHYLAGIARTHHKIGRILERLLLERHRADYQDDVSQPLRPLAQLAVQESQPGFCLIATTAALTSPKATPARAGAVPPSHCPQKTTLRLTLPA